MGVFGLSLEEDGKDERDGAKVELLWELWNVDSAVVFVVVPLLLLVLASLPVTSLT